MKPSAERLRELLDYDPLTGVFIWKRRSNVSQRWNTKNAGKVAGSNRGDGYHAIAIDKIKYRNHCLAWVHVTGEWPPDYLFVDHKNLNRADNRFDNLRLSSFGENSANAGIRNDNKSGFRGVCFNKKLNTWRASIQKNGISYHIGTFKSAEAAAVAQARKARELYGDYCPQYLLEIAL